MTSTPVEPRLENKRVLFRIAPGLGKLLSYKFGEDFRHDLVAGVSVAAVALPVAIAYSELAGLPPQYGLYSCILPLVAYAIFGTSRQLIVNPDAAACAMIAASVAPLAGGDPHLYLSLAIVMTFIAGFFCIIASLFRLGALADLLSKPILVGFLNGIAISILLGQVGKLCGFSIQSGGIIPRVFEIISKLPTTHWLTLAVGLGSFAVLFISKRLLPRAPVAMIAMILAGLAVALLKLDSHGVAILGKVPAGLPPVRLPKFPLDDLPALLASAAGLALVLFTSGVLTARSFASKNKYDLDIDQEFAAIGAANIASAVSQGFAVTGADSRTAMADASGGRTQVTGLIAAASIAAVLLFFTSPLRFVPVAALGAVLVFASLSLFDFKTLRTMWSVDRTEVYLSIITTLGVVAVGAINAILIAVGLAIARFVKISARPDEEILGRVEGHPGFHSVARHAEAKTYPGLVMYRFGSPITFFNCGYFKERVLAAADASGPGLKWFVVDAIPITHIDVTGLYVVKELREMMKARGITLIFAGRKTEVLNRLKEIGIHHEDHEQMMYPTLRQAFNAFVRLQDSSRTSGRGSAEDSRDEVHLK